MGKPDKKPVANVSADKTRAANIPVAGKGTLHFPNVKRLCFFLAIISFLVYVNTLNNGYVLDDMGAITKNTYVSKGISAIPEILSTPYHKGFTGNSDATVADDIYRPLSLVMFAIEYSLFNKAPAGSHFINILFFVACTVLLFLFLDRLFGGKKTGIAFIASLLFAVHPIHTEVVANIKSRDELLSFFFSFWALLLFISYARSGKAYQLLTGAFCFFLSLLSKETSVSFLAVIPLIFFFYANEHKKRSLMITVASVVSAVAYLVIRFSVLKEIHGSGSMQIAFMDNALAGAPSPALQIATAILMLGYYIKLLFIPYPLISEYGFNTIPFVNFSNVWVWLSLVVYVALVFIAVARFIKYRKDPYTFGISFFLLTLALFSNILFLLGATMAERFLFFPSAGFCLLAALLIWHFLGTSINEQSTVIPKKAWFVVAPIGLVFALLTISRNAEWESNYILFKADVEKSPNTARLWYSLGYEISTTMAADEPDPAAKNKLLQEGISDLQKSLSIYSGYSKVHNDLGGMFMKSRQYDSAESQMKQAIALDPKNQVAISDLGYVYFLEKKYRQAIALSEKALLIRPKDVSILDNIAICYLQIPEYDSAVSICRRVLQIEPGNELATQNLAVASKGLEKAGDTKK